MIKLTLELETDDARAMMTAAQDGALGWRLHAAKAEGDLERDYAELRAQSLQAAAAQIADQLIPKDELRWQHRLEEVEFGLA